MNQNFVPATAGGSGRLPARRPELPESVELRPLPLAEDAPTESIARHYLRVALKRRWVILAAILACLTAALIYTVTTQRIYRAQTSIEISRDREEPTEGIAQGGARKRGFDQEFYATQYTLLQSRALAEMVARDLRLASNDAFLSNYKGDADLSGL